MGHCGHYCVFLEQLILLVLKMSNSVADIDRVVWGMLIVFERELMCSSVNLHTFRLSNEHTTTTTTGVIPNFQRLLRLFCHVIMRVQQFDPSAPKLADMTESGLPPSIAAEEKRRISDENSDCLLYTSPSPRDMRRSRMPSSA